MKKIIIYLFVLMSVAAKAQNNPEVNVRYFNIEPSKRLQNIKKSVTLNETGLIPLSKGDEFTLRPNLIYLPRQHKVLKGVLKSTAAFALTYKVSNTISNNKSNDAAPKNTNLVPALGISIAAGLPNIIQGLKTKKSYLLYTLYDANKIPVSSEKILLKKQTNNFTFKNVTGDGYLYAIVIGNTQRVMPGNLDIVISEKKHTIFKGEIAENYELNSFGDCQGGDDHPICACLAGCNLTWSNCADAADAALVSMLIYCNYLPIPLNFLCMSSANESHTAAIESCNRTFEACGKYCRKTYDNCY